MDNNNQTADPEQIKEAGEEKKVNQELVSALRLILADAEKGNIQGIAVVRVVRAGAFNVFTIGGQLMEFHAGSHLILDGCKDVWKAQLQQIAQQAMGRGLQRATPGDLDRLPKGFFKQ